jgi:hypothetical protein
LGAGFSHWYFGSLCGRFSHGNVSLALNHYLLAADILHTVARRPFLALAKRR